ncbi:hypothetical protein A9Q93_01690 [Nonlabens dokdonensis]|uniref:Uncharacterized protein n=1 Tax=Nonlabens dokdonensis TaxID=328515 RepID=A0A1Z8BC22_9FLAO|nr:hypothetical protein [Nonlabens dokdonensis]OUS20141.1 hypothetical protein A9Q93_01690 [Nonlabens dokdonensis]
MKVRIALILVTIFFYNCDTHTKDYSDLESITFYNSEGNEVSMDNVKKEWNTNLSEVTDSALLNPPELKKLSVKIIRDNATNEDYLVLVASTSHKNAYSGKIISSFKDGFLLSDESVICVNCGTTFKGELVNGKWICAADDSNKDDCIKINTVEKSF